MWKIPTQDTVGIVVEYSGTTYDSIKVIMFTIVPQNHVGVMVIFGKNGHFGKLLSHWGMLT